MSRLHIPKPGLSRQDWFLLTVLGWTSFFDGYDGGILAIALKQIRGTYGLSESEASLLISFLYLGAIPALFITRAADRIGRRRLLTWSVFGYTIATVLTALAPNAASYGACQLVAKLFLHAEYAIVWALAAEELPARARGFGFGWLAMNSALGVGFGAILCGGFLEPNGVSWRWLYVVSLPTLAMVAVLRRQLPESRRFVHAREKGRLADRWHAILRPPHGRWLKLIVVTTFLVELTAQAGLFTIDFLQTERGLSATAASFMLVAAGLPGIPIMVMAGSLSDRHGRKLVGCTFALMSAVGAVGFFWLPGGIPVLLPCMMLTIVGQLGAWPTLRLVHHGALPDRGAGAGRLVGHGGRVCRATSPASCSRHCCCGRTASRPPCWCSASARRSRSSSTPPCSRTPTAASSRTSAARTPPTSQSPPCRSEGAVLASVASRHD